MANLERNLIEINSAKEQVNKVVISTRELIKSLDEYLQTYEEHSRLIKNEVNDLKQFDFIESFKNIDKKIISQSDLFFTKKLSVLDKNEQDLQSKIEKLNVEIIRIENIDFDLIINKAIDLLAGQIEQQNKEVKTTKIYIFIAIGISLLGILLNFVVK